jgi:shikimate kinase
MMIMLTFLAHVVKSSISRKLAEDVGFQFFDLDVDIERFYGKSISTLIALII